ncbi:N-glycosylase/DNA lyase [Plasmodium gonderi]|uniref:DNA-(apurinic or apyrimidinic site) lyase n=1 Tax=Plasmodium gonderi TaxID=77519 RepID=A0A1Y1JFW7_PLAGO|nr:N-glycosylase/DNA lyase [Plasmodium gonderi]GAW80235.1 N-glycosylase/DNA lyase [Plasmodium gonderi]
MMLKFFKAIFFLSLNPIHMNKEIKCKTIGIVKMSNIPERKKTYVKTENSIAMKKKKKIGGQKVLNSHSYINTTKCIKKNIVKKNRNEQDKREIMKKVMIHTHSIPESRSGNGRDMVNINVENLINGSTFSVIKNFEKKWEKINVSTNDLQLKYCFLIGQEFCFSEVSKNTYIGLINKKIYLFKETEKAIYYQCIYDRNKCIKGITKGENNCHVDEKENNDKTNLNDIYEKDVEEFFNLQFPLRENIEMWKKKDKRMNEITHKIKGLRILKADSVESFFSFLCSTNNNIPRITLMIECLRRRYGKFIATIIFHGQDLLVKIDNHTEGSFRDFNRDSKLIQQKTDTDPNVLVKLEYPLNSKLVEEYPSYVSPKGEQKAHIRVKKEFPTNSSEGEQESAEANREESDEEKQNVKAWRKESDEEKKNVKVWRKESGEEKQNVEAKRKKPYAEAAARNQNKIFYEHVKTMIKEEKEMKIFPFYEFPSIEIISKLKEEDLRNLGFGYRSSYVIESAKMLTEIGSEEWIENLKKVKKTKECIDKLIMFPGIGLKVANCICLFGLNKFDCIPIDTHIYDIIYKYYKNIIEAECKPVSLQNANKEKEKRGEKYDIEESSTSATIIGTSDLKNKKMKRNNKHVNSKIPGHAMKKNNEKNSTNNAKQKKKALTTSLYIRLYTKLKNLLGPNCGWAQTILFASELKKFSYLFE